MFSPPLVPGGRVIYPLSAAFHGRAVSVPNGKAKFLKKLLRTAKCARPQDADERKGNVSSN